VNQLRQLFSDTVIYGIGYIAARLVTFLLLPFYTNILTTEQYGLLTLGLVFAGIIKILYKYGADSSLIRFYNPENSKDSNRQVFSTLFWSLLITSVVASLVLLLLDDQIAILFFDQAEYSEFVLLLIGIIIFDTVTILPKTLLRMQERPVYFSGINLLNVMVTLGLNIYFIAILSMGVYGAFLANFIASGVLILALVPAMWDDLRLRFSSNLWKEMLQFGVPLILVQFSAMIMELIDRPILKEMTDIATVGLYGAGYKLGIFMMLIVVAYNFAWQPFFMKVGRQEDGPQVFSRIFTYFMFVMSTMFVILTLLLDYIAGFSLFGYSLIGEEFRAAIPMVPIIFAAYMMYGAYVNFLPGIYLKKRTGQLAIYTSVGAVVNVIGNFLLIPILGIYGAALATLLGYLVMAVVLYFAQQRLYPIPYRWGKVGAILIITVLITSLFYIFQPGFWGRTGLILLYLILPFLTGLIRVRELRNLAMMLPSRRRE